MKKILILIAALSLASCANIQNAYEAATQSSISPKAVIVAANTFDALEATATNYLRLPKCGVDVSKVCRNPNATKPIVNAVRSGRVARNNLEQFMINHPGQLGPSGPYDILVTAIDTLNSVYAQYNVGK